MELKSQNEKELLEELINDSSKTIDLRKEDDLRHVNLIADRIYNEIQPGIYSSLEEFYSPDSNTPLMFKVALKLAKSKHYISRFKDNASVSVVLAMYKENNRILTNSLHPNGEDFLNVKVNQLNWLFSEFTNYNWELILVDDGCPENSGRIARDITLENKYDNVKVLFLEEAINRNLDVVEDLDCTKDSQKGGSILYGMHEAAKSQKKNHVILYTDADLSTHLGQTGLLTKPILEDNYLSAIGSRREDCSVVIKESSRNDRGKMFIYSWKRMIPHLDYVIDTQCGFKAFSSEIINDIVKPSVEKKFAFDIELLLKTESIRRNSIYKVPIAWVDSEAESTTTNLQPYLPMLKSISKMHDIYIHNKTEESIGFAEFFKKLKESQWNTLLERIPLEIKEKSPTEFSAYNKIKAYDLEKLV